MNKSRIAITGAAGFIGAALANKFSKIGHEDLLLIDNLSTGNWLRLDFNSENITLDISKCTKDELIELLSGVSTLFHLSAVKLHNEKNSFEDLNLNNMVGTQRLFEAAGAAGVQNIVFTSSLYAYGLPDVEYFSETDAALPKTMYGASKIFGENALSITADKYSLQFSIARLFFIYGEKQFASGGYKSVIVNNFERIKNGLPAIINGDGEQILDYLYIGDCVDALICLAEKPQNGVLNVASGIGITIKSLIRRMLDISGTSDFIHAPADWTSGTRRVGTYQKLKASTGWTPQISIDEGLLKTWESLN